MTFADRVWAALGPAMQSQGGALMRPLVDALCAQLTATDYLVQPVAGYAGTPLSNVAVSPYPRWLAQLAGVTVPASYTDAQARTLVGGSSAATRGTVAALTAAVQATLTGTMRVDVYERTPDAYSFTVVTYSSETPDATATATAAMSQKPVGLIMSVQVVLGQTLGQLAASGQTLGQLNQYTYQQILTKVPS